MATDTLPTSGLQTILFTVDVSNAVKTSDVNWLIAQALSVLLGDLSRTQ